MTDIVQQSRKTHLLHFLRGKLSGEILNNYAGKVHCPDYVLEPRVVSGWVNILSSCQLPYSAEPLHGKSVNHILLDLGQTDVAVDWVFNEPPEALRFMATELAA